MVITFSRIARSPEVSLRTVSGMAVTAYMMTVFVVGVTVAAGMRTAPDGPDRPPMSVVAISTGETEN